VKHLFLIFFIIAVVGKLTAQNTRDKNDKKLEKRERIKARLKLEEEMDPPFKKYNVFGVQFASDGYGMFFEKGYNKTPKKTTWYRAELVERKHPKEKKTSLLNLSNGQVSSLIYGKTYNFFQFKLGTGIHQLIGGKANKNGIAVSALYGGGISLGLLKPYLVSVFDTTNKLNRVPFATFFENPRRYQSQNIPIAAGITRGWNQLKVSPGLHAKGAVRFDNSRFNESIMGVEAGLNIEYYFAKVRQMVLVESKNLFFNAYVAFAIGKRK
jgi:hypothetical protein